MSRKGAGKKEREKGEEEEKIGRTGERLGKETAGRKR